MRRNLIGILLFALALIGRLILPIAAEAHAIDPLADAPICTHDGSAAPLGNADGPPGHAEACDAFCCHVAPAFAAPAATLLPVDLTWRPAEWLAFGQGDAPVHAVASRHARGPPTLS